MADQRKRKWDEEGDSSNGRLGESTKSAKVDGYDDLQSPSGQANGNGSAPVESAVAAAARIAAQYAKGGGSGSPASRDVPDGPDAAFFRDIDINDSRNRYVLTKGATQEGVKNETGATVITKGTWLPDRTKANDKEPALYLHITAPTQAILDAGVEAVEKLLAQELGPLVVDYRAKRQEEQQPRERRKWPEEKIPVNLDSLRNFNVRAKIIGPQGLFVKHIQQETSARVQIKGQGSGFIENDTGRESDEPMHVHISGMEQIMVDQAKELAEDLLVVVREEWGKAKAVMDQYSGGNPYAQYQQPPPPPSYDAPAPPSAGGYAAPPPPPDSHGAPPPPPGGAQAPPPPAGGSDVVSQAQALAPQIDRSLLEFYAGHSQDPATIVYYAQLALQYQQQGYYGQQGAQGAPGSGAAPPQPPAQSPTQAQMASMNAYGTPTQPAYGAGGQQPAYGGGNYPQQAQQPPPPPQQQHSYGYSQQQSPQTRQGKGSYANMPPPPGL